jgi:hypothetical protein
MHGASSVVERLILIAPPQAALSWRSRWMTSVASLM